MGYYYGLGLIVKADSNLAQPNTAFGGLALRKHRLLGPLYIYFIIMIGNLILRFAWTLTLVQQAAYFNTKNADVGEDAYTLSSLLSALFNHLTPMIAAAEVLRRMVWGFLRVEWEHIEKMNELYRSGAGAGAGAGDAAGAGAVEFMGRIHTTVIRQTACC